MKILVALAFVAILASLAMALVYMMRGGASSTADTPRPKGHMARALAFRVGFSILLFVCVLVAWKMGWIQPSGIPAGA
jgi:formate/nitrite transporter FocA (FNT family)